MFMTTTMKLTVCILQLLVVCSADHHVDMNITISNLNGDSRTELLFDGVSIHRFGEEYTVPMRHGVSLLGVDGIGAIFLVKTSNNFVSNSSSWRCTTDPDGRNEWWTLWYDDSRWPVARVVNKPVPDAFQPAKWITAQGARTGAGGDWVYCRGAYGTPPATHLTGASHNSAVEVYFDGTSQGSHASWWTMHLPPHVSLVAVSANASDVILASTDDVLSTPGDLWRCSSGKTVTEDTIWFAQAFDDSSWLLPVVSSLHSVPVAMGNTWAQWIRANGATAKDSTYCRANYTGTSEMTTASSDMTTGDHTDSGATNLLNFTKMLTYASAIVYFVIV